MAKKTNKTSHVLNLLTNGAPEGEEAKESRGGAKEAGAPEPHGVSPENKVIVVNETSENEKLSNEIKNRLEAQLEAEVAESAGTVAASAADEAPAEPEPSPEEASAPAGEAVVPAEPAVREAEPVVTAPGASEAQEQEPKKRAYNMLNVMERLLSDMEGEMENEMRQNGVCMCDRCRADVQALVLTNMPAKYVIVDSSNASPILGYHKNRYKIAMLTEILKACSKVKEAPRH
ncbi:MAG: late competence development ComFB family protein [Lachnospiraceae bacterium]|nr:late competence development ComFB family protein [Lachnospiraceae bacterium]